MLDWCKFMGMLIIEKFNENGIPGGSLIIQEEYDKRADLCCQLRIYLWRLFYGRGKVYFEMSFTQAVSFERTWMYYGPYRRWRIVEWSTSRYNKEKVKLYLHVILGLSPDVVKYIFQFL